MTLKSLYPIIKAYLINNPNEMENTVTKTPTFNYTRSAWEGKNYNGDLDITEIAKLIREDLKIKYPKCRFSITTEKYSGGRALNLVLTVADFKVFVEPNREVASMIYDRNYCRSAEEFMEAWGDQIKKGHRGVNQYYIKDDYTLTDEAKEMMTYCKDLADSFNFDDSDAQVDYFHTNFYMHLGIGKWDKPVVVNA